MKDFVGKEKSLVEKFVRMFKCDTARICQPCKRMFLIIGWNRNTKDNESGYWEQNGKRWDFDYIDEKCIASGNTEKELIVSARHYKSLLGKSWADLLFDKHGKLHLSL